MFFQKYKQTKDVALDECYIGGKNCGTCAHCGEHDSNWRYFENAYCTCALRNNKEGCSIMTIYTLLDLYREKWQPVRICDEGGIIFDGTIEEARAGEYASSRVYSFGIDEDGELDIDI